MAKMQHKDGDGCVYVHIGHKHINHLVVSLLSLRDVYDGPVALLTAMEPTIEFVEKYLLPDKRFGDLRMVTFEYDNNGSYFAKTNMFELSPFERTVFFDSDTLIVGDFSELFPDDPERIHLTSFANWSTRHRRIISRVLKWKETLPDHVRYQLANEVPAINTGVLGFTKQTRPFMERWRLETGKAVGTSFQFICDEIAAQLLFTDYPHRVLDERWNCSPRHSSKRYEPDSDKVRVWHGHGKKFLKNTEEWQERLWLPYYRRALEMDLGRMRRWTNSRRFFRCNFVRPSKYLSEQQKANLYNPYGIEWQ